MNVVQTTRGHRASSRMILTLLLLAVVSPLSPTMTSGAEEPLTLRLWYVPDTASPTAEGKANARIIERFRELHPHVEMQGTAGIRIPQIGSTAALLMSIAGGIAPDVVESESAELHTFVQQGFLLPLDDYLRAIPEAERYERAPKRVWDGARMVGPDGKEHVYAVPWGYSVTCIKVRRDLASRNGYPPERLPTTWDAMYRMAQAMTTADGKRFGIGMAKGGNALAVYYRRLLVGAGGRVMERREDGRLYAAAKGDTAVMAMDYLWKLIHGKWTRDDGAYTGVVYSDTDLWNAFKRGRYIAGFHTISSHGMLAGADKERFLLLPTPKAPNGQAVPIIEARYAGLYAGQANPETLQAAFDFLWMSGSREGREIRTRTLVEEEHGHHANPLDLEQFGFDDVLAQLPAGYLEFYKRALRDGHIDPSGPNAREILRALANPVQRVLASDFSALDDDARRQAMGIILEDATAEINERLYREVPPKTKRMQQVVALLASIAVIAAFVWQIVVVHRAYAGKLGPAEEDSGGRRGMGFLTAAKVTCVLAPALVLIALWEYLPLLRGTLIAFQDYRFLTGTEFVGTANFVDVLFSSFFWAAVGRTLLYVTLAMAFGFVAPIFLALVLHELPVGTVVYRVLYYLPALTSGIVVMFLWKSFYDPSPSGYLNYLLTFLNVTPQSWLDDPNLAMLCCIIPVVWAGLGPGCLIYLAALKSIPDDLFESAAIDGCSPLKRVRYIVFPYMKPLVIMNFIGAFVAAFHSSGYILILTGGGPDNTTLVLSLEIFYEAYARLSFGTATAMSWILALMLIGFTLFQIKYLSKVEFRSASAR